MIKVGITGQSGFIGTHLYNRLSMFKEEFELITCCDEFFNEPEQLNRFIQSCDTIVHLAALNRHDIPQLIYRTNIELVNKLITALEFTQSKAHVLFASSTQEDRNNPYGKSKKEGRALLLNWAQKHNGGFTGLVIPNVFGPFGNPFYNSVIATFSQQLAFDEMPKIEIDAELKLIFVGELVDLIVTKIMDYKENRILEEFHVNHTTSIKVTDILKLLLYYNEEYKKKGVIPALNNSFEINLFNTFRCYLDIRNHYPVKYKLNTDNRGVFVEIIRLNIGGQVSFSITAPSVTRGNHFHTRKIERFSVIKGDALIQLRKIGTSEVMEFYLSGNEPAYVDMPIWYTHNITNIGQEDLYTIFWINEFYNPDDPDTFFEKVICD